MGVIFVALQIIVLLWFGYWLFISFFGFGKAKENIQHEPMKRFIMLIAANNEENVIGDILDNLKLQNYPKDLYDVCVIADNCNDKTADIGREKGAMVLEHYYLPGEPKGKPYAIKYALENIDLNKYDGVCIFDADNLVTVNYLQEMNNHLCEGHRLIQCNLDTKNPRDNFITLSYATSYYMMNRFWQLAKSRLGLGNAIGGTGFCVESGLFKEIGWTAQSLTEDLEFTMQALLKGIKTHWCHYARVLDEKPTEFKASCVQRLRWARGHWDVCFKYSGKLIKKGILERDMSAIDGAMYLLNPGKVVVATLIGVMFYLSLFSKNPLYDPFIPMWVYAIIIVFNLFCISIAIKDSNDKKITTIKSYISLLFISYSYIPLFVWSLITYKNKTWVTTKHTRSVDKLNENDNLKSLEV